jgi:hypothetical protein
MPIIGLTDRAASFPQIGILRKGGPKTTNAPGKDLDHFRFDPDDEQAREDFAAAYGATPRVIRIYLPFDTADENLSAWKEHWVAGGLVRRCDGQTSVLRQKPGGKGYDSTPHTCACVGMPEVSKERCKPVGRLKVIIPELKRLAYVTALTTSIHDIMNLSEQLRALEGVRGGLRGIPMILSRIEREISMPGNDGKRVRRAKWLLAVEAAPHWVSMQLEAQERAARPALAAPAPLALPAPEPAPDTDDGDEVVNVETGEILPVASHLAQVAEPKPANERTAAMHEMRAAYDAAVTAGADVPRPAKEDVKVMSLGDIRMWTETYRAEAERGVATAKGRIREIVNDILTQSDEAEADERGPEPEF